MILSVFSGMDILGKAFRDNGFMVVSAGDILWGQDIANFIPTPNQQTGIPIEGVIGGSPCQDFSKARRTAPTGKGLEALGHFIRVVNTIRPSWFLLENVPQVPSINIEGYHIQRFSLQPYEVGGSEQNRNRHFQFGSLQGLVLQFNRLPAPTIKNQCVTASPGNKRITWSECVRLQDLPEGFDLPLIPKGLKMKLLGNGVNYAVANEICKAIISAKDNSIEQSIFLTDRNMCLTCNAFISDRKKYCGSTCRGRAFKKRKSIFVADNKTCT